MLNPPDAAPKILIVDDDAAGVELIARILHRAGITDTTATTNPQDVVPICRAFGPDIILLDLVMPGIGGFAVMEQLQAELPDLPAAVIVLTGEHDIDVRIAAYERGARDFVTKPCRGRELLARIGNIAEVQRLQRRLQAHNQALEDAVAERTARLDEALDVLRQAEAKLRAALAHSEADSRAKSQTFAETAHEMRTPLNAICGFAEAMATEIFGPIGNPRYAEYVRLIHGAGNHLLAVINDVLDLSKVEAGGARLELHPVELGPLVTHTVDLLQQEAQRAGVRLAVKVAPEPLVIATDETKIRQILLNMTGNAIKFTPPGGQVTVEVGPDPAGGAAILIIRDTGIGIAPEDMPTVMSPYGQVASEMSRRKQGTGLGMPLTKRMVELLGGSFALASEPGRGTVVTIRFPGPARLAPDRRCTPA